MKANELRLGNWVRFNNYIQPESFICVNARFFSALAGGRPSNEINNGEEINNYYSGISLTPEILEKAGFVIVNSNSMLWYAFMENNHDWRCNKDGVVIYKNQISIKCKYLHQLQNLHFALTGEELNINL